MTAIKAIIIDDEQHCIDALTLKLTEHCPEVQVLDTCTNASEGVHSIKRNNPDIIFLDVNMPEADGFDVLEKLDGALPEVVFTTAYDKYAVKAFEFNALHFLLKPIKGDDLVKVVQRYRDHNLQTSLTQVASVLSYIRNEQRSINRIALPVASGFRFVELNDILFLKAESNYTTFYLVDGVKLIVPKTLKEYENMLLEEPFVRVHNSYIINLRLVAEYKKTQGIIVMKDQTNIEISSRKKAEFLSKVERFLKV